MAVVMSMRWSGVNPEQYDGVREALNWDEQPPEGLSLHAAWFDADGLHVTDVWNSEQAWQTFFAARLGPAVEKVGLMGQPDAQLSPLHRRYVAPGVTGAA